MKFHLSTGVVLVQGSNFRKWRDEQYDKMRSRVDVIQADISSPGLSQNSDSNGKPKCDGDTFPEKSSDRDTTGPGPNKDDDVTHLKLNDDDCQDQCNNDANVDLISIVTDRDSIDAEAAGISGNDNTCIYQNDTNDMITKLENAYIHMCDSVTESLNGIRAEIAEVKNEIRKLPVKIFDMVRKEQKSVEKSVADLTVAISQNDKFSQSVLNLTAQLQHQNQEMWRMQRALAAAPSWRSPGAVPHTPDTHGQGLGVARAETTSRTPDVTPTNAPPTVANPHHQPVRCEPHPTETQMLPPPVPSVPHAGQPQGAQGERQMPSPPPRPPDGPMSTQGLSATPSPRSRVPSATSARGRQPREGPRKHHIRRDAILIGDSTVKYIDNERFMGRSLKTHIQRASTTATTRNCVDSWHPNPEVQFVVIHKGLMTLVMVKPRDMLWITWQVPLEPCEIFSPMLNWHTQKCYMLDMKSQTQRLTSA